MNTTTKTTLGILGGIGVGFCLGLLVSPDKGSNNRKKLVNTAGDWTQKLKHMFSFSSDGDVHRKTAAASNGTGRSHASGRRPVTKRKS